MKILDLPSSGSIGSETASRNRHGQYRRQRSMPVQPNSAAQVNARARVNTHSAGWRGLTDAQRAAWNAFANSFTVTNSLGQAVTLTGHQAYVKVNCVNSLIGDAAVSAPPALPAFAANVATALTATAGTPVLKLTATSPTAGTKIMVYASPQRSAGVSFEGDFRYMATFTTATSSAFDILTAYTAKFGALIAGKRVFVKAVQSQAGMQDGGVLFTAVVGA